MKYEILLNSVFRLPMNKATKLLEDYQKNVGFKNFAEQQKVLDVLAHKSNTLRQIKEEAFNEIFISLAFMVKDRSPWSKATFENIKGYPMIIWIEGIGAMEADHIMSLLNNYSEDLPSSLIETCIINLPEDMQLKAIEKYKNNIKLEDEMFYNFYYSVSDKARLKLREFFPNQINDDILLELKDLDEKELIEKLSTEKNRLIKLSSDDLVEFILLKSRKLDTLNKFLELYMDKVNGSSLTKFELLFTRYRYLVNSREYYVNYEKQTHFLSDSELFRLFKDKFHQIGIEETLSLFDNRTHYKSNKFTADVVLEFLDIAYSGSDLSKYINDETILEIITRFVEKCNNKDYSIEDFERLVKDVGKDGKTKLIFDDYIEAIIACGKLLKERVINDQNPLFLELRNKFSTDLLGRCEKDGTYPENISLNGVFYRLAKGSMPFDKVYMTKTYKGLIYLSKCGQLIDNADYITEFLTDEQLAKLNITPVIRWKNAIHRTNTNADNLSFVERMGLQLLCYFGKDRGKYLLESNMQGNRMENLFDGLKYENVSIAGNGVPNINEELITYLFGKGMMKEPNSVINRMIRGDIPEFERYFTEFCNCFEEIKKSCNGVLSVKRIVKHFEDIDLPIELKPDEIGFKHALREMNTTDPILLSEAIELCKDTRNRGYSSIPKVEGQLGDFTYKILDLDDPLAVAVGYLSHCCFVVRGISYSALKHSMQSRNGRTFVVYYKGQFLTQSWVWRNGDVICFDSVEAGSPYHEMYKDDIKLADVYKRAASEMLYVSQETEDDIQKVKVVTIGKSDYIFNNLKDVEIDAPRPLENDVYVYDSYKQQILAGTMPEEPRYGVVGAQYRDPRKRVVSINDVSNTDIDTLDEVALNVNSLRYQVNGEELPLDFTNYTKIVSGDGWYILVKNDGSIESGLLNGNEETKTEYDKYLSRFIESKATSFDDNEPFVKRLEPLNGKRR